jgi:hypothetical protein
MGYGKTNIEPKFDYEYIGDPLLGIVVYKNCLDGVTYVPDRLHSALDNSEHEYFKWHDSLVGEGVKMPEYRDCVDFKMTEDYIAQTPAEFDELVSVYNDVASRIKDGLAHYQAMYNINMNYMEAINFVRYGENEHFGVHTDHGFSYICTVSNVTYLNDDYEGGELHFPLLNVSYKPEAGDSVFFPSTYIYAHAALPVKSGVKYSAVTMFDYNDDAHQHGGFSRDFGQSNEQPTKPSFPDSRPPVSLMDNEELRAIINEEIHNYAMASWKAQQQAGNSGNYTYQTPR